MSIVGQPALVEEQRVGVLRHLSPREALSAVAPNRKGSLDEPRVLLRTPARCRVLLA